MAAPDFAGFPEETFAFLKGISAHNDKAWFDAHRADYDAFYVGAGREFVSAIGPRLADLSPGVRFEPKVNGSISRINRDTRFSRDKRPYKDRLELWFWHGDKRSWDCPGFYVSLSAETVFVAVGMYGFPKPMLDRYRALISDPGPAAEIKAIIDRVASVGPYTVSGKNRKAPPRGLAAEGVSAEMLCYESLGAMFEWEASVALEAGFVDFCLGHWRKCWPIGRWMLDRLWRP